jgi:hypothetical protein
VLFGYRGAVTGSAHLRVLAPERCRIEARPVGIKPPSRQRRMAGETIPFRVTSHAALQVLPCGLAMAEQEEPLGIMIAAVQLPSSTEPGLDMAIGTELARVVAVTARGLPGVRRRGVPGEESRRMVAGRGIGGIRPVAVETLRPHMTTLARLGTGTGDRAVLLSEVTGMRGRTLPTHVRSLPPTRSSDRQRLHRSRLSQMTGETALLRVTGRARTR